jgi:ornithine cyclodeaminase/alanine dehydrogenase-like protein (mu-crystallin family)
VLTESAVPAGCFVAGLCLFQDIDPELSRKSDKWVIGNRVSDGAILFKDNRLSCELVYADMGEIVTGSKPGRENNQERILYTHMGMGAHDVVLAHRAYTKALKEGKGIKIRLI